MADGGPQVVYQPIFHLASMNQVGVEALSRFPDSAAIGVEQWFSDALEVDLAVDLDLAIVARAVSDLPTLPGGYLSVNLSPVTAVSGQFAAFADTLPLAQLVVEITEHQAVADYHALATALRPWRTAGLRIAVDDVGAGYASMRHILTLSPDIIKIDRSLVASIDCDHGREALIVGLVAFARETGACVVAEGIETAEELAALQRMSVGFGQGYRLGVPAPLAIGSPPSRRPS